ncbi:hypothetical protein M3215_11615 [Bacillus cytotoxicus]|uniref:Uncharacterized protein n=1 Tax=Bacillus cytotoxicus TaxID=580165 RepID=A0ACC6A6X4_9BACI|nr:hypothetical protein [Bacillus cytotoxicus]
MIDSYYFNSVNGDRRYDADDMAKLQKSLYTTGVIRNNGDTSFKVVAEGTSMRTKVQPGGAVIEGRFALNDDNIFLTHDAANATYDRIDLIVLRLDLSLSGRKIEAVIKKGTASATPVVPTLQVNNIIYEIQIAEVLITKGKSFIDASQVKDKRAWVSLASMDFLYAKILGNLYLETDKLRVKNNAWLSRSRNAFAGDTPHQAYGSAATRVTFPRIEVSDAAYELTDNNGVIKVKEDGRYIIMVNGQIERGIENHSFKIELYRKGSPYHTFGDYRISGIHDVHVNGAKITDLRANDTIEIWVTLNQKDADYKLPYVNLQVYKLG